MARTAILLLLCSAVVGSLHQVEASDEGTLCRLPRCTNLIDWTDGCGDGCDDACDSDEECANDGPGRGGCGDFEHCVTARYDKEVKGQDYCDCPLEALLDCFSSVSTVEVEHGGKKLIKDLQVGEKVLTGSSEYIPVYTMDHKHPEKLTSFLQIYSTGNDSPLEVTESHMVFLHGQQDPIPASAVKVGDTLQTFGASPSVVTDISTIKRNGLWNPITMDGTIVVDGIVTSTYSVPFKNNNNGGTHVEVAGLKLVSHHDFLHLLMSPYQAVCVGLSLSFCESKHEYNVYSWLGTIVMEIYHQQGQAVQDIMVFSFLVAFKFLELIMKPCVLVAVFLGIYSISMHKKKKSKVAP